MIGHLWSYGARLCVMTATLDVYMYIMFATSTRVRIMCDAVRYGDNADGDQPCGTLTFVGLDAYTNHNRN